MRDKQEILKSYCEDGVDSRSDAFLSMLTVLDLLEVLIDIRDIIDQRLKSIDNTVLKYVVSK